MDGEGVFLFPNTLRNKPVGWAQRKSLIYQSNTVKVWYMHNLLKYEFDLEFDLPVGYPATAPELALPELDGKTEKM